MDFVKPALNEIYRAILPLFILGKSEKGQQKENENEAQHSQIWLVSHKEK